MIITGASSGIGRETASVLAALKPEAPDLVLHGRNEAALAKVADECRSLGAHVATVSADLCSADGYRRAAAASTSDGYLVLVNNAGSAIFGDTAEIEPSDLADQVSVGLTAPILLTRLLLPAMLERGGGQIVNVLSVAATHPFPGASAYCAAKAGLLMFGRSLAAEHRSSGIRVTSLILGATDTPLWGGKFWSPERSDMLTSRSVAEAISDAILAPLDRNYDEIVLMPPKGIL